MVATPFWFGPRDRPLFGWLHLPDDGQARAGVVLCPPLGIESICTYFTYRTLASRLAESGVAALRFDYDGTGDSYGVQDDPDRVSAWQRSVSTAVEFLTKAGPRNVGLLGVRVGALLAAAEANARGGVDALVLWDPCLSGQSFLREQKAFRMLSLGGDVEDDGSVEAPGVVFSAEAVGALSQLDLLKMPEPLARRLLVLEDPGRPRSRRLANRLAESEVDWDEATGQADLLDPPRQETPWATIDRVVAWLSKAFDSCPPVAISGPATGTAVVGRTTGGTEIIETPVRLGPAELFGIVTEPANGAAGPTMVFVNEGSTPHVGQSRMWVELAREWAANGLRVLRFDLSGNGDSPTRPGQEPHVTRAPEAFDDVEEALRAVSPDDPSDVVLIGLCSGAYQAVEAGLSLHPRGVCLVNPILTFETPEQPVDLQRRARQATKAWFVAAARPPTTWIARRQDRPDPERWIRSLELANWPAAIARRQPRIPELAWRATRRALVNQPAADVLERVVARGVDVFVVCSKEDLFPIALGARHVLRRLVDTPGFRLVVPPGLDHAGLIVEQRRKVMSALTEHVLTRYAHLARSTRD